MKLGQIIKMVMMQAGEDIEDTDEYREGIIIYINEGYRRMMEKYQPTRTATLYTDAGVIDLAAIRGLERVKRVRQNESGREVRYVNGGNGRIYIGGGDGTAYDVEYTYEAVPLEEETQVPEIPDGAHMALADYATWRFYSNGNIAKQQRGQVYYQRFQMELDRLKPQGQRGGGLRNFHGLYDVT